jgi:hypothetical protein
MLLCSFDHCDFVSQYLADRLIGKLELSLDQDGLVDNGFSHHGQDHELHDSESRDELHARSVGKPRSSRLASMSKVIIFNLFKSMFHCSNLSRTERRVRRWTKQPEERIWIWQRSSYKRYHPIAT